MFFFVQRYFSQFSVAAETYAQFHAILQSQITKVQKFNQFSHFIEERNFESKKSAEENYRGEENPLGFTEIGTLLAIGDDFDAVFGIFDNNSQF